MLVPLVGNIFGLKKALYTLRTFFLFFMN